MSDKDYLLLMNQKVYDLSIDNIKNDILNNSKKFLEQGSLNDKHWVNYHELTSPIATTMKKIFQNYDEQKVNIFFGTGAIYGVNKQQIIRHSKDFYITCIDVLNNSLDLKNPDEGHSFERLWHYIFKIFNI